METLLTPLLYALLRHHQKIRRGGESSPITTRNEGATTSSRGAHIEPVISSEGKAGLQQQQQYATRAAEERPETGLVQGEVLKECLFLVVASALAKVLIRTHIAKGLVLGAHKACKSALRLAMVPLSQALRPVHAARRWFAPRLPPRSQSPARSSTTPPEHTNPNQPPEPPATADNPVLGSPLAPTELASDAGGAHHQPQQVAQQQQQQPQHLVQQLLQHHHSQLQAQQQAQQQIPQQQQQPQLAEGASGASSGGRRSSSTHGAHPTPSSSHTLHLPNVVVVSRPQRIPVPRELPTPEPAASRPALFAPTEPTASSRMSPLIPHTLLHGPTAPCSQTPSSHSTRALQPATASLRLPDEQLVPGAVTAAHLGADEGQVVAAPAPHARAGAEQGVVECVGPDDGLHPQRLHPQPPPCTTAEPATEQHAEPTRAASEGLPCEHAEDPASAFEAGGVASEGESSVSSIRGEGGGCTLEEPAVGGVGSLDPSGGDAGSRQGSQEAGANTKSVRSGEGGGSSSSSSGKPACLGAHSIGSSRVARKKATAAAGSVPATTQQPQGDAHQGDAQQQLQGVVATARNDGEALQGLCVPDAVLAQEVGHGRATQPSLPPLPQQQQQDQDQDLQVTGHHPQQQQQQQQDQELQQGTQQHQVDHDQQLNQTQVQQTQAECLDSQQQQQQLVYAQLQVLPPPWASDHQCVRLHLRPLPCSEQEQQQQKQQQQQQHEEASSPPAPTQDWVYSHPGVLSLPPCVGAYLVQHLDADGVRVLRSVCRILYFEATRAITQLVITPDNLATLVAMPLHEVMPLLRILIFRTPPALGGFALPGHLAGPQAPAASLLPPPPAHSTLTLSVGGALSLGVGGAAGGAQQQQQQQQEQLDAQAADTEQQQQQQQQHGNTDGDVAAAHDIHAPEQQQQQLPSPPQTTFDLRLVMHFAKHVLPHLKEVAVMDFAEAPLHAPVGVWQALAEGVARPDVHFVLREPSAWVRGAMGLLGLPDLMKGDGRDHYPALHEALRVCMHTKPQATVDLLGVTIRRHTAARVPLLCMAQCLTSLTIFGKSVAAVPHGHRLATHLHAIAGLKQLRRLELLSYEDVSDMELAPLASCSHLQHLYIDSLFIKQAVGPVFPSLTSLTAARIKFILRPLTTVFPNLTSLRLGVLHSELNKKISSASLSCLAGCSKQLTQLCVCPVLWKGQWQVLPILPGLRRLVLVHCKDLGHLREVLQVVSRSPSLEQLELHSASPAVAAWPGANDSDTAGGGGGGNNGGAGAANGGPPAAMVAATAAAAGAAAAAAGGNPDMAVAAALAAADAAAVEAAGAEVFGSVADANLYSGLRGCKTLKSLVLQECSGQLVRHLAGVELPALQHLSLRRLGPALRWPDLQAAILALPSLRVLELHASGEFGAAAAAGLPDALARPALQVDWRSTCTQPSLTLSHE